MNNPRPAVSSLDEARRAARCRDWLARTRANTPERRAMVRYRSGIVWRQYREHLARVLEIKARADVNVEQEASRG